jgi:hypothetical protein
MSSKTKTKQTVDYNKPALNAYEAFQPQILQALMPYLQGSLMDSPFFREALMQGARQASLLGQRGVRNVFGNLSASGMSGGGMSGFLSSALGRAGRAQSGLQSNAFWNAYGLANQARLEAAGQAQGYRPLQMGQTTVEKKSGLGTWLPQTLGTVAGFALAPFTGGMSLLGTAGARSSSGFFPGAAGSPGIGAGMSWTGSAGGFPILPTSGSR